MRSLALVFLLCLCKVAFSQFQDERIDPVVNVYFGYFPFTIKGIGDTGNGNGQDGIPSEPYYTSLEEKGAVGNVLVQLGADINVLLERDHRSGIRILGGVGNQAGLKNADGLGAFALELGGQGFYRRIFDGVEVAAFLGYKRYWSALAHHFVTAGIELDFSDNWGVMVSSSLNKHKYYRAFTNGFEEPAYSVRELGIALVYRY